MSKELKLYLTIIPDLTKAKKVVLNAKNLKSLNGVLNAKGIIDNLMSQVEEVKKGEKEYDPFIQIISAEKLLEIQKEISFKVKVKHHNNEVKLYTEFGVNIIKLVL